MGIAACGGKNSVSLPLGWSGSEGWGLSGGFDG